MRNKPESQAISRRNWIAAGAMAAAGTWAALFGAATRLSSAAPSPSSFRLCLNTATIRGYNLSITQEIDLAIQAGYQAIEPWLDRLGRYVQEGGSLNDLRKRIQDGGLTVEGAIGFASWCVDDDAQRQKGFDQAKREMEWLAQIGAKRMAAPPAGVPRGQKVEIERLVERYRKLLELGDQTGVTPILEFWALNQTLGKLSTAVHVAIETGHPKACVLADIFHMYRGGSPFDGLRLLGPLAVPIIHINDYPAQPPPEKLTDGDRVFPGDGVAPLGEILKTLQSIGAQPVLSLELFNKEYWKQPPLETAKTGRQKLAALTSRT